MYTMSTITFTKKNAVLHRDTNNNTGYTDSEQMNHTLSVQTLATTLSVQTLDTGLNTSNNAVSHTYMHTYNHIMQVSKVYTYLHR